jgi:hypothetical protein
MDIVRVTQRLRSAADQVYHAWPMMQWQKVAGPGPEVVTQKGREPFAGLALTPGQDVMLRCQLAFPATVAGVPLAGDALELTIFSIYPLDLSWNRTPIFTDEHAPVAAGPALVRVLPRLQKATMVNCWLTFMCHKTRSLHGTGCTSILRRLVCEHALNASMWHGRN